MGESVTTEDDRETLRPAFDLDDFARRSEEPAPKSRPLDEIDRYLDSMRSARGMLEPPESVFMTRLDDRIRRAELLLTLLKSGGLPSDIAVMQRAPLPGVGMAYSPSTVPSGAMRPI